MESPRVVPMTRWRGTALALVLFCLGVCASCGDVFRPVVIPLPSASPDPRNYHFVIVVSQNAPANPGSAMQIDVSGDTDVGVVQSGRSPSSPVHAALLPPSANRVYVANGMADTVSVFTPASVLGGVGTLTTISLPSGSNPVFVHSTESSTMYAASQCPVPTSPPTPACTGPHVAAISTASNVVTNVIPVGLNPVTLAETPNGQKLYSVNQGNLAQGGSVAGTITSISTVDKSVAATITCAVPLVMGACPTNSTFISPVWAVASLDSTQVFVLDSSNGVISSINTAPPNMDQVVSVSSPAGKGANFLLLDRHLNRLYVTNASANTLSIYDAGAANALTRTPPALIATLGMPTNPVMVTALNDGTQVFVISFQASSTSMSSQVTAIRTSDDTVTSTVNLSPAASNNACQNVRFRASITSSADSSRVYASVCDAGATYVIKTTDDTCVDPVTGTCRSVMSPVSAYPAVGLEPPPQNPVWVVAQ